ncbi:MAG: type II secretion system protein GspG [Planctomycetota bacterium]
MLEALVALSILLSLSGVLMPAVGEQVGASRQEQALNDMQTIASGLAAYSRDTLFLPTGSQGRTNIAWLYGPGEIPENNCFGHGGEARPLGDVLLEPSLGGPGWAGPYAATLQADPWGHAYLVNSEGWVSMHEHAMVLSAGPDGVVQTEPSANRPAGDDLVLILD